MKTTNTGRIVSLSLAHLLNDWYMNFIQTLLPFLVLSGLGLGKGAFLISAFTITSSLLQPIFGYLVDKKNQRWMVYVGTIWMAFLISLIGIVKNYSLLLIIAALSGLGTAAFHPQASAMISAVSGEKKGFFQAFFAAAGNIGWALTPLLVVPVVQHYGLSSTPIFILPGLLVSLLLFLAAPHELSKPQAAPQPLLDTLRSTWQELTKIVAIVAFRSLVYFGLIAFLPLYLQNNNVSLLTGSKLLFLMLFSGAIGGLIGGYLSDKIGRKAIIVSSLLTATPLFYCFLNTSGLLSYLLLALAGAFLLSSFSATVVLAQEIISKNAAMASGLMLGFGIGMGGLGVGLMGLIAERTNPAHVVNILIWFPLLAGSLGFLLKDKSQAVKDISSST